MREITLVDRFHQFQVWLIRRRKLNLRDVSLQHQSGTGTTESINQRVGVRGRGGEGGGFILYFKSGTDVK